MSKKSLAWLERLSENYYLDTLTVFLQDCETTQISGTNKSRLPV
jgi:hypothetical protein